MTIICFASAHLRLNLLTRSYKLLDSKGNFLKRYFIWRIFKIFYLQIKYFKNPSYIFHLQKNFNFISFLRNRRFCWKDFFTKFFEDFQKLFWEFFKREDTLGKYYNDHLSIVYLPRVSSLLRNSQKKLFQKNIHFG